MLYFLSHYESSHIGPYEIIRRHEKQKGNKKEMLMP